LEEEVLVLVAHLVVMVVVAVAVGIFKGAEVVQGEGMGSVVEPVLGGADWSEALKIIMVQMVEADMLTEEGIFLFYGLSNSRSVQWA
jgi:hypothetical protein